MVILTYSFNSETKISTYGWIKKAEPSYRMNKW